jgi:hypothetical protein
VKLRAWTPAGIDLRISVRLTGYLREFANGVIDRVEICVPPKEYIECDEIEGDHMRRCLWAEPRDLCTDDGNAVSHAALRAQAARVLEQQRADAMRGPLGEYWP